MFMNGPSSRQSGTTLVEVLVALLILAIGLLGMLGLQTTSLSNTQSAYLRTQATILSEEMVDRMRANAQGVDNGAYNNASGTLSSSCMSTTGCSASAMASHDLAQWQSAVSAGLPSGAGRVCLDSSPEDGTVSSPACDGGGEEYAIKIWWDDDRDGSADQRFVVTYQP